MEGGGDDESAFSAAGQACAKDGTMESLEMIKIEKNFINAFKTLTK